MEDPDLVRGLDAEGEVGDQRGRLLRRELPLGLEARGQGRPLDELHDQVGATLGGPAPKDDQDVGVRDSCHRVTFAAEALDLVLVAVIQEDLDRHLALEHGVPGAVDGAEPAPGDLPSD